MKRFILHSRFKVFLVLAAVLLWLFMHFQIGQMDARFFQRSFSGTKGLVLYLMGDYGDAAKAYRAHFRETVLSGKKFRDPAFDALLSGDLRGARDLSLNVLEGDPDNVNALLNLIQIALTNDDFRLVLDLASKVFKKEPDQYDAVLLSAVAHTRMGVFSQAIRDLDRALRHNTTENRITSFLSVLEVTGQLAQRERTERPLCLLAHYYRYLRIFDDSNARLAIRYAARAIEVGDHTSEAYYTQAIIAHRHHDSEEALTLALKAIAADPKNAQAYTLAGTLYSNRGDLLNEYRMREAEAKTALHDQFHVGPYIHFLTDKMGDYYQALSISEEALQTNPTDPMALWRVADLHFKVGNDGKSVQYYQQAIQFQADNPNLYLGLALASQAMGRSEEGIAAYRRAIGLDPNNGEYRRLLAHFYWDLRRFEEALGELGQAVQLGSTHLNTVTTLCMLHDRLGHYQQAADCYNEVLSRDPRNPTANQQLRHMMANLRKK